MRWRSASDRSRKSKNDSVSFLPPQKNTGSRFQRSRLKLSHLGGLESLEIPTKNRPDGQAETAKLTTLQAAFLDALLQLAQRETSAESIALPSGPVEPSELRRVVVALLRAKGEVAP
jgi:hypothetical protein